MTSQEKDKFICQQLGLCWHPKEFFARTVYDYGTCLKCNEVITFSECDKDFRFESEAGRVQLLKLIKEHKDFDKFIELMANPHNFILFLTDDVGKFRDAVFRCLGGVE